MVDNSQLSLDSCPMRNNGSQFLNVPASRFPTGTAKVQQSQRSPSEMTHGSRKPKETEAAQACRTD